MIRLAHEHDIQAIHALRESLAAWQISRGIVQWVPGEVTLNQIETEVGRGEWNVLDRYEFVEAAVRVIDADPGIWTDDNREAGYIHGLMVARARAGEGLGRAVLREAEALIRKRGRRIIRLDCVATNLVLRQYYESQN